MLKYNKLLRKLICYKIVGIKFFLVDSKTKPDFRMDIACSKSLNSQLVFTL